MVHVTGFEVNRLACIKIISFMNGSILQTNHFGDEQTTIHREKETRIYIYTLVRKEKQYGYIIMKLLKQLHECF